MHVDDILHGMFEEYESENAVLGTVRSTVFCCTTATMRTGKIAMKRTGDPDTSFSNLLSFWRFCWRMRMQIGMLSSSQTTSLPLRDAASGDGMTACTQASKEQ